MRAGLSRVGGKEQRTAKALGAKAVGVLKWVRGIHAQAGPASRRAIGVARHFLVTMAIEGDGGNAFTMGHGFVDVPKVEGGIGGHMDGEVVKGHHAAQVERAVIGHIGFIEG